MAYELVQLTKNEFPELLSEIPDSPEKLWYKGTLPETETKLLSVVGSRAATAYGQDVTEKLIEELAGYPISIVSGLALGIDGVAHRSALKAGLHTIAVPGSGLDNSVLYPATHRALAGTILESGGTLLSEFEPNFRATPWSFPQRNRIMAGISHATLVVEATMRSGTLITARLALDYNRELLTVPGSIFQKSSEGPHHLIRNGAAPVTSAKDILEALAIPFEEKEETVYDLSPDEEKILSLLDEPKSRDDVIVSMEIPVQKANILLSGLELKGLIIERMGELHKK